MDEHGRRRASENQIEKGAWIAQLDDTASVRSRHVLVVARFRDAEARVVPHVPARSAPVARPVERSTETAVGKAVNGTCVQRNPAVHPPSMEMFCPVTQLDSSDAR
jgi:hypothetical protein